MATDYTEQSITQLLDESAYLPYIDEHALDAWHDAMVAKLPEASPALRKRLRRQIAAARSRMEKLEAERYR